jgi:hypothetical protein
MSGALVRQRIGTAIRVNSSCQQILRMGAGCIGIRLNQRLQG